jgi:FtsP/CotA-like multicopper oxidase with cupredoxin domain
LKVRWSPERRRDGQDKSSTEENQSMNTAHGHGGQTSSQLDLGGTALAGPVTFNSFGCDPPGQNPDTPDRVAPDVSLTRKVFDSGEVIMPDGKRVEIWGFEDPNGASKPFPSALIRVREGQVVHTTIEASKNTHTIHHHGIEPTAFNDGVGHTSFEVSGSYTYQWRPQFAGTYFYHCHKNTVLHAEMGMYGLLIVDPAENPPPGRKGIVYSGGPAYDVEALWAGDEIDPVWHTLNHNAGMCGEDVGLNDFNPQYFLISGVPNPRTRSDPRVMIKAAVGQTILIRYVNAGYTVHRLVFATDAEVVGVDGRQLGGSRSPYSRPFLLPAGKPLEVTSAQRYELLLQPAVRGSYSVFIEFRHWVHGTTLGIASTTIEVS